jgi:methylphosphotriester-DNA--protein-cysteine methyltransferase
MASPDCFCRSSCAAQDRREGNMAYFDDTEGWDNAQVRANTMRFIADNDEESDGTIQKRMQEMGRREHARYRVVG